jgi:hypothetical protein
MRSALKRFLRLSLMASLEMLVNITMSSTPCLLVYAFGEGEGEGGEGAARNERQRKAIPPARHHASVWWGGSTICPPTGFAPPRGLRSPSEAEAEAEQKKSEAEQRRKDDTR